MRIAIVCLLIIFTGMSFNATAASVSKDNSSSYAKGKAPAKVSLKKSQRRASARANNLRTTRASAPQASNRPLSLYSSSAIVIDQKTGSVVYDKNADEQVPIASLTKLMTAMVVLDGKLALDEPIRITEEDIDRLRGSRSRLPVGAQLPREELIRLALMASENRAASALGRVYPGGRDAFIAAMNHKARALGLSHTSYSDSTGLSSENVSTARELSKIVSAAYTYPLIRQFSTTDSSRVRLPRYSAPVEFRNTNGLVKNQTWDIGLSKTGYTSDAGHCLVMQADIANRPMILVLLDSWGKQTRIGDANRIRKWMERGPGKMMVAG